MAILVVGTTGVATEAVRITVIRGRIGVNASGCGMSESGSSGNVSGLSASATVSRSIYLQPISRR
jgi:hypothetical protein